MFCWLDNASFIDIKNHSSTGSAQGNHAPGIVRREPQGMSRSVLQALTGKGRPRGAGVEGPVDFPVLDQESLAVPERVKSYRVHRCRGNAIGHQVPIRATIRGLQKAARSSCQYGIVAVR